jgi:hypothetical protein
MRETILIRRLHKLEVVAFQNQVFIPALSLRIKREKREIRITRNNPEIGELKRVTISERIGYPEIRTAGIDGNFIGNLIDNIAPGIGADGNII